MRVTQLGMIYTDTKESCIPYVFSRAGILYTHMYSGACIYTYLSFYVIFLLYLENNKIKEYNKILLFALI